MNISPTIKFRDANREDADSLAERLRPEDIAELQAASKASPTDSLRLGVEGSDWCEALDIDGVVAALFGVSPFPSEGAVRVGVPWMLCAKETADQFGKISFQKKSLQQINKMHETYPHLVNLVDARNTKSIQWLASLGFGFTQVHSHFGHERIPFIQFERTA